MTQGIVLSNPLRGLVLPKHWGRPAFASGHRLHYLLTNPDRNPEMKGMGAGQRGWGRQPLARPYVLMLISVGYPRRQPRVCPPVGRELTTSSLLRTHP